MAELAEAETAAQIERDIATRRDEVAGTLDALQQRAAPGLWVDAAGTLARREGAALSQAVICRVRARPVAAAMVAAGIAWLLLSDAPRRGRRPMRARAPASPPL
jgi:Flp pilus assembly protein TadB